MMRTIATILLTLSIGLTASGANIQWDCFQTGYDEGRTYMEWHTELTWAYLSIEYVETSAGLNLSVGACIMESSANWYLAECGSIVDASTALGRPSYFATFDMPSNGGTDFYDVVFYDIVVPEGAIMFLGLATLNNHTDECLYGWVALENYNGELLTVSSAVDLDGGPMYVGGGSAPSSSPEPSSGLLLLLGSAVLALRRRRI